VENSIHSMTKLYNYCTFVKLHFTSEQVERYFKIIIH